MNNSKNISTPQIGHPGGQGIAVQKPKDFKGTFKKLLLYISNYKISLFFVFVLAIASALFIILGPKILGNATTEIFNGLINKISGNGQSINFTKIANILIFLSILYLISALFSYLQNYIMTNISMKVTYNLRKDIMQKINKLPLEYFDKTSHGDILSRITNDIDTLTQTLNQSLTQLVTSATTLIGILIMMISISLSMTLVALTMIPLSIIVALIIIKKSQKYFKAQQEYLGRINGQIEEMYGGHIVIKAFTREEETIKNFEKDNKVLYLSSWKSQFLSGLMMPIINSISNAGYVFVCILGGYLITKNTVTIGGLQAFMQYVRQFNQPVIQISNISNIFQQAIAAAERVFNFLEEKEEIPETENALTIVENKNQADGINTVFIDGTVQFNHVKFGYTPEKIIIKDFSENIKNGYKIAIVGPTGAGKSTIIKLLMRFYDVNSGEICVSNQNIKKFKRNDIRSQFGMVLQETWLFSGTIMENLRYGNLKATDEEVVNAAKIAQVDHFIRTLPYGYNTKIDEESNNISQGQKQLLTIARAILANPKMLILDEATSSVDTMTEKLIGKAVKNIMNGRTSFVIAHRLSTITDADLILVMNNGDIVEQGTHEQLLKLNGSYAELYNSQLYHS